MLRNLGIMDFLLVPFPSAASAPMQPMLRSIQMAREDFAVGGRTGWRACRIHVRQALADWNSVEPLDVGKSVSDKTKLTEDQRLDRLREALREFMHIAGHQEPSIAREWTRDDALLALSGICALVNAKKP